MAYKATILLGRILKVYGFEGAVTLKLEKSFVDKIPVMESVFIETEGKPVPFFIEESEYPGGDILRLRFKWYDTAAKMSEFAGSRVFLTSGKAAGKEKNPGSFMGFSVSLPDGTIIGIVTDVIENPGQWLLELSAPGNRKLLVPLHEDLIKSVDRRQRSVIMDLPDGLMDIN
jgi:16S rRNA processing protein RimM